MAGNKRCRERGLSMVELLISLGVLAIAMGSVLAMFVAGSRMSGNARARTEAARVARSVVELVDAGVFGKGDDKKLIAGEYFSQGIPAGSAATSWRLRLKPNAIPPYVESDYERALAVALVWRCTIEPHPDGVGLYLLTVEVRRDVQYHSETHTPHPVGTGCCEYDDADEFIGVWTTFLADRKPTP